MESDINALRDVSKRIEAIKTYDRNHLDKLQNVSNSIFAKVDINHAEYLATIAKCIYNMLALAKGLAGLSEDKARLVELLKKCLQKQANFPVKTFLVTLSYVRHCCELKVCKLLILEATFGVLLEFVSAEDLLVAEVALECIIALLQAAQRPVRNELRKDYKLELKPLVDFMLHCGDYSLQEMVMETFARLAPQTDRSDACKEWFKDFPRAAQEAFLNFGKTVFQVELKPFLNTINDKFETNVHRVSYNKLIIGAVELFKPQGSYFKHFSVNVSFTSKCISIAGVEKKGELDQQTNPLCLVKVTYNDIKSAVMIPTKKREYQQLTIILEEPLESLSETSMSDETVIIIILKSVQMEHLKKVFGQKLEADPLKVSSQIFDDSVAGSSDSSTSPKSDDHQVKDPSFYMFKFPDEQCSDVAESAVKVSEEGRKIASKQPSRPLTPGNYGRAHVDNSPGKSTYADYMTVVDFDADEDDDSDFDENKVAQLKKSSKTAQQGVLNKASPTADVHMKRKGTPALQNMQKTAKKGNVHVEDWDDYPGDEIVDDLKTRKATPGLKQNKLSNPLVYTPAADNKIHRKNTPAAFVHNNETAEKMQQKSKNMKQWSMQIQRATALNDDNQSKEPDIQSWTSRDKPKGMIQSKIPSVTNVSTKPQKKRGRPRKCDLTAKAVAEKPLIVKKKVAEKVKAAVAKPKPVYKTCVETTQEVFNEECDNQQSEARTLRKRKLSDQKNTSDPQWNLNESPITSENDDIFKEKPTKVRKSSVELPHETYMKELNKPRKSLVPYQGPKKTMALPTAYSSSPSVFDDIMKTTNNKEINKTVSYEPTTFAKPKRIRKEPKLFDDYFNFSDDEVHHDKPKKRSSPKSKPAELKPGQRKVQVMTKEDKKKTTQKVLMGVHKPAVGSPLKKESNHLIRAMRPDKDSTNSDHGSHCAIVEIKKAQPVVPLIDDNAGSYNFEDLFSYSDNETYPKKQVPSKSSSDKTISPQLENVVLKDKSAAHTSKLGLKPKSTTTKWSWNQKREQQNTITDSGREKSRSALDEKAKFQLEEERPKAKSFEVILKSKGEDGRKEKSKPEVSSKLTKIYENLVQNEEPPAKVFKHDFLQKLAKPIEPKNSSRKPRMEDFDLETTLKAQSKKPNASVPLRKADQKQDKKGPQLAKTGISSTAARKDTSLPLTRSNAVGKNEQALSNSHSPTSTSSPGSSSQAYVPGDSENLSSFKKCLPGFVEKLDNLYAEFTSKEVQQKRGQSLELAFSIQKELQANLKLQVAKTGEITDRISTMGKIMDLVENQFKTPMLNPNMVPYCQFAGTFTEVAQQEPDMREVKLAVKNALSEELLSLQHLIRTRLYSMVNAAVKCLTNFF